MKAQLIYIGISVLVIVFFIGTLLYLGARP
jgi:preprotein translocase subunit SecE